MQKVLLIAYFFPPAGVVGVYRTLKFVKYLPQFGWEPVVLTTSNGRYSNYDEGLLDLVPEGIPVHRCRSFEAFNKGASRSGAKKRGRSFMDRVRTRIEVIWHYLNIPDPRVWWVPSAARSALRIMKRDGIRHVYISGSPYSSFLIGAVIKWFADARVVIDYRDPWTQNLNYYRRSRLQCWLDKRLERWVTGKSDVVVANTRHNNTRMIDEFGRPGDGENKFVTIHNGFDAQDFKGADPPRPDRFTITYAGVFYYSVGSDYGKQAGDDVMRTYSPLYFFDALERLYERRPDIKERMRVNFMGRLGEGYDPIIAEKGLDDVVRRLGYLDYDDHIDVLKASSALLLVLSRGEKSRGWIPSKFYQYMGSGNPILALVPEGEVRAIIEETRTGVCVEPDDVDAIAKAVEGLFDRWAASGTMTGRNEAEVGRYERRYLTGLLARALDSV